MIANLSHTESEMLEARGICESFDLKRIEDIAKKIGDKQIILTGMGSSVIFPAKQAKNRAIKLGVKNKIEVYFVSDLFQYDDFSDTVIFLASNSGQTKEVILFLEHALAHGGDCIAITAQENSPLAQKCSEVIVLKCGFEKGVAATKSVVEQALIYDSLIFNLAKLQGKDIDFESLQADLKRVGQSIEDNIKLNFPTALIQKAAKDNIFYFVGLENGVTEEITLKASEITRKMAVYYPDTQIVHGAQEAIDSGTLVLFGYKELISYLPDFEKFSHKTNTHMFVLGTDTSLTFKNYSFLASGWGFLRSVAAYLNIDIDHPLKATKVGNLYQS